MSGTIVLVGASREMGAAAARYRSPCVGLMGALYANGPVGPEAVNAAAPFGLEGAALALRTALGPLGVGVTPINPGNVATGEADAVARWIDMAQVRAT
jgi:NAD(P)-dependent dehydrogenase (short-subunit alcohol dehydrogenase family)